MDMAPYLSPPVQAVLTMVSRKVRIVENGSACRTHDIFGFFNAPRRELTVCSNRIVSHGSPYIDFNETVLHESVHVAQGCRTSFRHLTAFGIKSNAMPLGAAKLETLKKAITFNASLRYIDREAIYMEDKPELVAYVVRKYCF